MENRYLPGMLYWEKAGQTVWRMYDQLLEIKVLAFRAKEGQQEQLYRMAQKLERLNLLDGNSVKILAVKKIDTDWFLLFSVKNAEEKKKQIQAVLAATNLQETQEMPDFSKYRKQGRTKEQVLPCGTILNGQYQVLDCVGIGGFGIVYLCQDFYLKRLVAVKEYFPEQWAERESSYVSVKSSDKLNAYRFGLQSFYEEAKMMAKFLNTPHIVTIYDVFQENDTAYLVMEYLSGISIGREMRLREYKSYSAAELSEIINPVMDALEAMHDQRIVHSDISPGNIMRTSNGDICLIDMGAAKYTNTVRPVLSAAFLKVNYAAPEQYRTARQGIPYDEGPWTDIYALGATIYYLLTGQKPPDIIKRLEGKNTKLCLPKKPRVKRARQWQTFLGHAMEPEIKERIGSIRQVREESKGLLN